MDSVLQDRIRAGAAYLDSTQPGWRDRVVVNDLNLGSVCRCVLGQVFTPVVRAQLDAGTTDYYVNDANDDDWRTPTDRELGYYNGYGWAVRDQSDFLGAKDVENWDEWSEPDTWTDSKGNEFISSEYARELAFDDGGDYGFEAMNEAWTSYLKGEWV